ncbi:hypothetical protein [Mesorhizobium sp. Root157]|nr:hypothetical protein [Mesorhizobium sp. Root157]
MTAALPLIMALFRDWDAQHRHANRKADIKRLADISLRETV